MTHLRAAFGVVENPVGVTTTISASWLKNETVRMHYRAKRVAISSRRNTFAYRARLRARWWVVKRPKHTTRKALIFWDSPGCFLERLKKCKINGIKYMTIVLGRCNLGTKNAVLYLTLLSRANIIKVDCCFFFNWIKSCNGFFFYTKNIDLNMWWDHLLFGFGLLPIKCVKFCLNKLHFSWREINP